MPKKATVSSAKSKKAKSTRSSVRKVDRSVHKSLLIEKLPGYFLIVCLLASLAGLFWILWPFVTVILVAAILTITFYPVYKRLLAHLQRFWWGKDIAAVLGCLLVVLVIVLPVVFFGILFAAEALNTYELVQNKVESGFFDDYFSWFSWGDFNLVKDYVAPVVDLDSIDVKGTVVDWAASLSNFLFSQTLIFVEAFSSLLFGFVLMLFSMFYFFRDGEALVEKLGFWSPLPYAHEAQLFKKVSSMVDAIMLGVFLTAAIQGTLGGIGFAIVGIPNPIFWGIAMAFFSLIPMFGTGIIWAPAALIMLISGSYGAALFLLIWGIMIGGADNFIRPYFIGGKVHTYPLMTFFVILGGVFTMGLKGVVFGPLILMLVLSFLHIYEAEYSQVLKK